MMGPQAKGLFRILILVFLFYIVAYESWQKFPVRPPRVSDNDTKTGENVIIKDSYKPITNSFKQLLKESSKDKMDEESTNIQSTQKEEENPHGRNANAGDTTRSHDGQEEVVTLLITNGSRGFEAVNKGLSEYAVCRYDQPIMCNWTLSGSEILPESHAVLFRPYYFLEGDPVPKEHIPSQKWIFHETESPARTWNDYRLGLDFWNSFNLTILYTHDANLEHSRFSFGCKPDPDYKPMVGHNFAANKTGETLWMVSNCKTHGREDYVAEMQKYIDIDIYGHCGKEVKCGEFGELRIDCVKEFVGRWKFYLAFENTFCDNYYTEKLTKMIDVPTIPVVMGLVNYTEIMPPGSFIDVRDFSSPKELALYLKYLNQNDTAFNEYIEKMRTAKCKELFPSRYMCRLCKYLHEHRDQTQILPDMRKLWGYKERCQSREEFFKGIADSIRYPKD